MFSEQNTITISWISLHNCYVMCTFSNSPSTLAKAVTLLTCDWKVLCLILGPDNIHPDWDFSWFPSVSWSKFQESTINLALTLLSTSLPINYSLSAYRLMLRLSYSHKPANEVYPEPDEPCLIFPKIHFNINFPFRLRFLNQTKSKAIIPHACCMSYHLL